MENYFQVRQLLNKISTLDFFSYKRIVLLVLLLAMIWFNYSGMGLHHVWNSPFDFKGADFTYFLVYKLGLNRLVLHSYTSAMFFDVLLIFSLIMALIWIKNKFFVIVSAVLMLIYHILLNAKMGYHAHHLFGFHFALFPFCFGAINALPAFYLSRYLACLTYFFAGFFKLYHKGWSVIGSFSEIFQNQHAAYFYFHPNSFLKHIGHFLNTYPAIGFMLYLSAMLLQLSFILGFFTRRFDKVLAFSILGFHLMDWYLMNLGVFMGMTVMMWLFLFKPQRNISTI
ncbi:MAG: hypothetical protein Q8K70_05200 [Bacteroidota bacterium]|nr:hypothetical protein [Bacteroidota bacterium]